MLDDPRNGLVREYVRIVRELAPTYFLFENVKGLTQGQHRGFLQELVETFQSAGYRIVQPWRVLNAAHHGVPQHRERLFLLGAREGSPLPEYPPDQTAIPGRRPSGAALPPDRPVATPWATCPMRSPSTPVWTGSAPPRTPGAPRPTMPEPCAVGTESPGTLAIAAAGTPSS